MLGQAPECASFHTMFDWPDVVIEIKLDGSDIVKVLKDLAEQPERLQEISKKMQWKHYSDMIGYIDGNIF